MRIDCIYNIHTTGRYFYSPDGIGRYFYGSLAEANEDVGILPLVSIAPDHEFAQD